MTFLRRNAVTSRSVVSGWLAIIEAVAVFGCGGPATTTPESRPAVKLDLSLAPAAPEIGDTITVTVTRVTTTAAGKSTTEVNPAGATVSATGAGVQILAAAAPARLVVASAGGLQVTAQAGEHSASVGTTVTTPQAETLALGAPAFAIPVGTSVAVPVTVRSKRGVVLPGAATLSVLGVVGTGTVELTGTSIRLTAGADAADILVSAGTLRDTVQVFALASGSTATTPLSLYSTAVRRGVAFEVGRVNGASPTVRVGGVAASATGATDSTVRFTPDAAPFGTCLAPGAKLALEVAANGTTWQFTLPALNPVLVSPAQNDMVYPMDAVKQGCLLAMPAGTYDVQLYRWDLGWDTRFGGINPAEPYVRTPADSVAVVWRSPASATSLLAAPVGVRVAMPTMTVSPSQGGSTALAVDASHIDGDWPSPAMLQRMKLASATAPAQPVWRTTSGGSCPVPTTPGDTVVLYTQRVNGVITKTPIEFQSSSTEPWILVASGARVSVLADSSYTRRLQANIPSMAQVSEIVRLFDANIYPYFTGLGESVPDRDGTGRVVILLSDATASSTPGAASVRTYGRPDCPVGAPDPATGLPVSGAAEVLLLRYALPYQNLASMLMAVAHELGHVVDLGRTDVNQAGVGRQMWWSREGIAELLAWGWVGSMGPFDPLHGLATYTTVPKLGATPAWLWCGYPSRSALQSWFAYNAAGYGLACQFHAWALQSVTASGVSFGEAVRRLLRAQNRSTMAAVLLAARGTTPENLPETVGDFYASWVVPAGGSVPRSDLQFGAQDLGITFTQNSGVGAYPVQSIATPGQVLRTAVQEVDLQIMRLTAPGEVLLEIRADSSSWRTRMGIGIRRR